MALPMIEERPSLFSSLMGSLSQGLGKGFTTGSEYAMKEMLERGKSERARSAKWQEKLDPGLKKWLKGVRSTLSEEGAYEEREALKPFIEKHLETSSSPEEAYAKGLRDYDLAQTRESDISKITGQREDPLKIARELSGQRYPSGRLGALFSEEGRQKLKEDIEQPGQRKIKALIDLVKSHPAQPIKEIPATLASLVEAIPAGIFRPDPEKLLSTQLKRSTREGLSPEEQEGAEAISFLESLFLPGAIGKGIGKLRGKGIAAAEKAPLLAEAEIKPGEPIPPKSLAGRVSLEAPEKATETRIARAKANERLYPTEKEMKIREEQLKSHPKYIAEIEKDASEREARRSRPLGPQALETQATRMAHYEGEVPKAREFYQNAISRVRALEDEVSKIKSTEQLKRANELLKIAKRELDDSEFFLKQTLNNAKTGEARSGLTEMRKAARDKILSLQDEIASGKEIKLAKRDYNPEWVKQKKALEKKKALPATKQSDYYTQVHDEYANEYRNRIEKIDQELKKPMKTPAEQMEKTRLRTEKENLQKMIDSAEGENAIHQHKMALREMQQRKLAKERLGKFQKIGEDERISRIRKTLNTKEGRQNLVDRATEEAKAKNPGKETEIEKEKENFVKIIEDTKKEEAGAKSSGEDVLNSKTEKEVVKKATDYTRRVRKYMDYLASKTPLLGRTPLGKDIAKGIMSGIIDAFMPSMGHSVFGLGPSTVTGFLFGRHGVATIASYLTRSIVKGSVKLWRINNIAEAYKNKNRKEGSLKIYEYKNKYSPKMMKEGLEVSKGKSLGSMLW